MRHVQEALCASVYDTLLLDSLRHPSTDHAEWAFPAFLFAQRPAFSPGAISYRCLLWSLFRVGPHIHRDTSPLLGKSPMGNTRQESLPSGEHRRATNVLRFVLTAWDSCHIHSAEGRSDVESVWEKVRNRGVLWGMSTLGR